jgi:hypothetical protein
MTPHSYDEANITRDLIMSDERDISMSGTIDCPEGYRLQWDRDGIEVTVTEYHPTMLKLDWDTILRLARQAGAIGGSE